jgi:hypothetical protein
MKLQNLKRQLQLQEWATHIKAQIESGMTVREWCEAAGIGYKNFYRRRKCVQEELLEELEENGKTSKISDLVILNKNQLPAKQEPPIIAPVTISESKSAALTVWIGTCAVDIQNGADAGTIDRVLKVVSQL